MKVKARLKFMLIDKRTSQRTGKDYEMAVFYDEERGSLVKTFVSEDNRKQLEALTANSDTVVSLDIYESKGQYRIELINAAAEAQGSRSGSGSGAAATG